MGYGTTEAARARAVTIDGAAAPAVDTSRRGGAVRCGWCGRTLPDQDGAGRRRKYCGQSCRQRAYEDRHALTRRGLPADVVVLSAAQRDDLADRLYQMSCAAEDVATALAESAPRAELADMVEALVTAARAAERIR